MGSSKQDQYINAMQLYIDVSVRTINIQLQLIQHL